MNFPSPTQTLQARTQPGGITPELVRLLAQMMVKQETDAAARDMAMKSGAQPPTVADSVNAELEGNARQKIEQKLSGLRALASQQAPQGAPAPAMAPPPPPTQHMASGGLTKLQSNLPRNYAGGGIVAFGDGGPVTEADVKKAYADWMDAKSERTPYLRMHPEAASAAEATYTDLLQRFQTQRIPGPGQAVVARPAPTAAEAPWVPADASVMPDVPTRQAPPTPRVPVAPPRAPAGLAAVPQTVAPAGSALEAALTKSLMAGMGGSGADNEAAARAAATARFSSELGGDMAALRAARQQDYETAKAAQAARDAKGELSIWDRMSTLGQNAGYGNWGKAAGQQRAMELAQEATKAEGAKGLLALKQASDAAQLSDKIKQFEFSEGKGSAALAAAAEAQKNAQTAGAHLAGVQGTNAAHVQGIGMQNETAMKVERMKIDAQAAAAKIMASRQEQVDKRNDITGLKSEIAAAEKTLSRYTPQALMLLSPGTPAYEEAVQEQAWAKTVRDQNRARLAELTGVEYSTTPAAVPVPAGAGWGKAVKQ